MYGFNIQFLALHSLAIPLNVLYASNTSTTWELVTGPESEF